MTQADIPRADAPIRIAVVEDDHEIRELVVDYMDREGFEARGFADGGAFAREHAAFRPELVVLDLMMPGEDGLSICRRIAPRIPVLVLSAKGEEIDRIVGLEVGADDYLPKPFNPRELVARIRAILRRRAQAGQPAAEPPAEVAAPPREVLRFAGWTLDVDARHLSDPSGAAVPLSAGELSLLVEFARRPRRVLSREQLLDWTRGTASDTFDRAVDVQLSRLRRKIARAGGGEFIRTIRNEGYIFAVAVERAPGRGGG